MITAAEKRDTHETSLTRRLGAFEHLIWSTDQWSPRHFVLVARIEGRPISIERLEAAFCAAQRRHPALRRAIQTGADGYPQFVPSDTRIEVRIVDRSCDTQWERDVEIQLLSPFRADQGPLLRATLVRGESVSELILASHHSIGDGISAMYLIRDLLESMEGYVLEDLPPRASLEEFGVGSVMPLSAQPPPVADPVRLERPGRPGVSSFNISSEQLARLLARCRQHGTTIQDAFLAAFLCSLPGAGCLSPVNVRRLCPPIGDDFGLYISSGTADLDRDRDPDFWTIARAARDQVARAVEPQSMRAHATAMASMVATHREPQSLYEAYRGGVNYGAVLSNLGRIPDMPRVREFRVTAVYPILNVELEPVIGVATAGGRLSIALTLEESATAAWVPAIWEFLELDAEPTTRESRDTQ